MTNSDYQQWQPEAEQAIDHVVRYEDKLQDRIDAQVQEDNLFEAGMLIFEHAELLARLKQSPAARHLVSTAIHFALNDMELHSEEINEDMRALQELALELSVDDIEFDPGIGILEVKEKVRESLNNGLKDLPNLTNQLGQAYMHQAQLKGEHMRTSTAVSISSRSYRRRTQHKTVGIEGENGNTFLSFCDEIYEAPIFGPWATEDGVDLGMKICTPNDFVELQDKDLQHATDNTLDAANMLLALPDDPEFIHESGIPYAPIYYARRKLQRELTHTHQPSVFTLMEAVNAYVTLVPPKYRKVSTVRGDDTKNLSQVVQVRLLAEGGHETDMVISNIKPNSNRASRIFGNNFNNSPRGKTIYFSSLHTYRVFIPDGDRADNKIRLAQEILSLPENPGYTKPRPELHD